MPKGLERTEEEKRQFSAQLVNLPMLFIGCRILALVDRTFPSRFWTQYEFYHGTQHVTAEGLRKATQKELRMTSIAIHTAMEAVCESLTEIWSDKTVEDAAAKGRLARGAFTNGRLP